MNVSALIQGKGTVRQRRKSFVNHQRNSDSIFPRIRSRPASLPHLHK